MGTLAPAEVCSAPWKDPYLHRGIFAILAEKGQHRTPRALRKRHHCPQRFHFEPLGPVDPIPKRLRRTHLSQPPAHPTQALKFARPSFGCAVILLPSPRTPNDDRILTAPVSPLKGLETKLIPALSPRNFTGAPSPTTMEMLPGLCSRARAKMASSKTSVMG